MAGKPELSVASEVQNVVVYISDDNFAQAYAVGQENVAAFTTQASLHRAMHNGSVMYTNPVHSMASVVVSNKGIPEKIKQPEYTNTQLVNEAIPQGSIYAGDTCSVSANGYSATCNSIVSVNNTYRNINENGAYINQTFMNSSLKNVGVYSDNNGEKILEEKRPIAHYKREECDNSEGYVTSASTDAGSVSVVGLEGLSHSGRCDSVKSEAADSSCSSLSSTDENFVVVQPQSTGMVVYDANVRQSGVVVAVSPAGAAPVAPLTGTVLGLPPPTTVVPCGWKRLVSNGVVIYLSPGHNALGSLQQVKEYLMTPGTCKCGLVCPLKYDSIFNFDPKVISKPWTMSPDPQPGNMAKLCNHKRKNFTTISLGNKPVEPKVGKDFALRKKKRKNCGPYSDITVHEIVTQQENQAVSRDEHGNALYTPPEPWHDSPVDAIHQQNMVKVYPDNVPKLSAPTMDMQLMKCQPQESLSVNQTLNDSSVTITGTGNPNLSTINISHQMAQQNVQNQTFHRHISNYQSLNGNIPNSLPPHVEHQQHMITQNNQLMNDLQQNPAHHINRANQEQNLVHCQPQQHKFFVNNQVNEPTGPGRPNIQMVTLSSALNSEKPEIQNVQKPMCHNHLSQVFTHFDPVKNLKSYPPTRFNMAKKENLHQPTFPNHQKLFWQPPGCENPIVAAQHRLVVPSHCSPYQGNVNMHAYERVPPIYQHTVPRSLYPDDSRKKFKVAKGAKRRPHSLYESQQRMTQIESQPPCPNVDVRQIYIENTNRNAIPNQFHLQNPSSSSPSFMEDPSGYLAQQTALLNSTISRQTGDNCFTGKNPALHALHPQNVESNIVPLTTNIISPAKKQNCNNQNRDEEMIKGFTRQTVMVRELADSTAVNDHIHCQECVNNEHFQSGTEFCNNSSHNYRKNLTSGYRMFQQHYNRYEPPVNSSSYHVRDDPVTSSTCLEKQNNSSHNLPDLRPIQGGTVSTSNVSPMDSLQSESPASSPQSETSHLNKPAVNEAYSPNNYIQDPSTTQAEDGSIPVPCQIMSSSKYNNYCSHYAVQHSFAPSKSHNPNLFSCGVVTTMASGRTVSSNTITSVLAGRANTATVSVNNPPNNFPTNSLQACVSEQSSVAASSHTITVNISKSPLEMVESVVSSIQIPTSHHTSNIHHQQISPQIIKHSPTQNLPAHFLATSCGQLIMASAVNTQSGVMPPPPPKIITNHNTMPPISVSPMLTNVTASVTQVIPTVAQQVLGQQTVLVNALPAPFVLQPGVTMTMDGMTVGQNVQVPQLFSGNVIHQQMQIDGSDPNRLIPRSHTLLSPETRKKGKKRKVSQTVASMLHIATQQNSGVVMSQQGFPQIQAAHSPQAITTGPMMQAVTIMPGKTGGQIVMNGQHITSAGHFGPQQLIANSQQTQQINLLQPVHLLNSTTGMVQNFPAIQQFIVPNLGGMVMNADGTATLIQDHNLGMQLQLHNVNGQNVLAQVPSNNMLGSGHHNILTAGPTGMVIRTPGTSQGKLIQQQHSPGTQFLSPTGGQLLVSGTQIGGQLSPLIANVSPTQHVTFGTSQQIKHNNNVQSQQDFVTCGPVGQLMLPGTAAGGISNPTSNQNATFVQQNTTIVQQQTTMVSNNPQLRNFQANQANQQQNIQNMANHITLDQNFVINSTSNKQPMPVTLMQRDNPLAAYRHSVSTQTAVNPSAQVVTTNTFCQTSTSASSPPDTTTHSPLTLGGHSPPTADTTTHTGSTDDALSPSPSLYSNSCNDIVGLQNKHQSSLAMVQCVSSSEPDSADMIIHSSDEVLKDHHSAHPGIKSEYRDIANITEQVGVLKDMNLRNYVVLAEPSGIHFVADQNKSQEVIATSRSNQKLMNKCRRRDAYIMDSKHAHSPLYEDEETEIGKSKCPHSFVVGDLVWGPAKGCPAWPGKLIEVSDRKVLVRWFGGVKSITKVDPCRLQTLSEGLDVHHHARKNCRKSRKLNVCLENAIQEAMAELDKMSEANSKVAEMNSSLPTDHATESIAAIKKMSSRLRGS